MHSVIKKWGHSAAVRLSKKTLVLANLDIASPVTIDAQPGRIVIEAAQETPRRLKLPFSESDLLKNSDALSFHEDNLAQPTDSEMGG